MSFSCCHDGVDIRLFSGVFTNADTRRLSTLCSLLVAARRTKRVLLVTTRNVLLVTKTLILLNWGNPGMRLNAVRLPNRTASRLFFCREQNDQLWKKRAPLLRIQSSPLTLTRFFHMFTKTLALPDKDPSHQGKSLKLIMICFFERPFVGSVVQTHHRSRTHVALQLKQNDGGIRAS